MREEEILKNTAVTPPPFRPSGVHDEHAASTPCPTLAERIAALGLDETTTQRLAELTAGIDAQELSPELLTTLAAGITRDEDVENADAAGYLRGRNEKIEAVLHHQPDDESAPPEPNLATFPRYGRRSVWD